MCAAALTSVSSPAVGKTGPFKPGVLLVDDEERILRSLRMMLGSEYRIRVTTSGSEALELLRQERFHVLVSDQRMPEMLGVDLLRQAREISPNTMRLLLTGYSDMAAIVGSINDGEIFRYLNKPWEPDDLRQVVRSAADIAIKIDAAGPVANPRTEGSGNLILLLDNDPDTATMLRETVDELFPGTYRIEWATNVEEALELLKFKVAVVVSEVRIDGEDITPFLGNFKYHSPDVVSVVVTAMQDNRLLARLINQGQVHRFLVKPLRKPLMKRALQSACERHSELHATPVLTARHTVQLEPARQESSLARRLSDFFSKFKFAT